MEKKVEVEVEVEGEAEAEAETGGCAGDGRRSNTERRV